jgi:hypothetical protein
MSEIYSPRVEPFFYLTSQQVTHFHVSEVTLKVGLSHSGMKSIHGIASTLLDRSLLRSTEHTVFSDYFRYRKLG